MSTPSQTPMRSAADLRMRRILRLPADATPATPDEARRAFQTSIVVATVRCLLMYIVFPFVLPAVGIASGVAPYIGIPISVVAILAISSSVRRFWRADHSKRWHYTVLGTLVICFLIVLIGIDIGELIS